MCWVSGKYLFFLCGKDEGLLLRISKWRIIPNSKNLNKLEANLEEISKNVEQASRAFPHLFKENMSCENIKMSVKKAKELILLEREFASIIDKEQDICSYVRAFKFNHDILSKLYKYILWYISMELIKISIW